MAAGARELGRGFYKKALWAPPAVLKVPHNELRFFSLFLFLTFRFLFCLYRFFDFECCFVVFVADVFDLMLCCLSILVRLFRCHSRFVSFSI